MSTAQNESIRRATLLITNLENNARIKAVAPKVGLNAADTLAETIRLRDIAQTGIDLQDEQEAANLGRTRTLRQLHDERWEIYKGERHYAEAKIQSPDQAKLLRLNENLARTDEEKLAQMRAFYSRALESEAILAQLASVSITRELLQAGKQATDSIDRLDAELTIALSKQKQATRDQTQALDELDTFRRKINRLLLLGSDNDPEVKDALGM